MPENVEVLDAQRLAVRGEFMFPVFGHALRVASGRGRNLPRIGRLRARVLVARDGFDHLRGPLAQTFQKMVRDWGGLEAEDLWRDPRVAFRLYRSIRAGGVVA